MQRIEVERIIHAPVDVVFERYTDHAGWSRWAGAGKVSLVREGSPHKNGVGCVRAFESAMGLQEEVTEFEPSKRMVYRVSQGGFPLKNHRGEVRFDAHGGATRVTWSAEFGSKIPLTERVLARFVRAVFAQGLKRFEKRGLTGAASA